MPYSKRVKSEGAFWRGRYHPTIIEPRNHLSYYFFYIDLNMLRAGVVKHPIDWKYCVYHELVGMRKRYCIIDIDRLIISVLSISLLWIVRFANIDLKPSISLNGSSKGGRKPHASILIKIHN